MSNNIPDPILRKEKYLAKIAENTAGGGSDPVILQANKNITANGIVNPDSGFDGFAKVTVNVPNTYSAADEGKVVSEGALISQVSTSVNSNNTYDTTYYNEVTVNVPNTYTAQDEGKVVDNGTLVSQTSKTITQNDTYTTTTNNEVIVNVPNTYTVSDEGKVVSSGALIAQTSYPSTVTVNDTYDTTNYNSITVDVPAPTNKNNGGKTYGDSSYGSEGNAFVVFTNQSYGLRIEVGVYPIGITGSKVYTRYFKTDVFKLSDFISSDVTFTIHGMVYGSSSTKTMTITLYPATNTMTYQTSANSNSDAFFAGAYTIS